MGRNACADGYRWGVFSTDGEFFQSNENSSVGRNGTFFVVWGIFQSRLRQQILSTTIWGVLGSFSHPTGNLVY